MGGLIAQLVWQRHRQLTAGLVLCAAARSLTGSPLVHPTALLTPAMTSALLTPAPLAARRRASAPPLLGWARSESPTAATQTPAPPQRLPILPDHAGLSAAAALRADLIGRYLLDPDSDPDRRAWALRQMRRTPLMSALAAVSAAYRFSSHAWAGNIDVPTAVIIPSRDRIVSPARQRKPAAAIPAAVPYELDGDHGVFLTSPGPLPRRVTGSCDLRKRVHPRHGHRAAPVSRAISDSGRVAAYLLTARLSGLVAARRSPLRSAKTLRICPGSRRPTLPLVVQVVPGDPARAEG